MKKLIIISVILLLSAPVFAQQTFNPHTGQWEQNNQPHRQPDTHTPPAGAIDSRTGTPYAPTSDSGVVDTKDGTIWTRNGDVWVNTRTGQVIDVPPEEKRRSREKRENDWD